MSFMCISEEDKLRLPVMVNIGQFRDAVNHLVDLSHEGNGMQCLVVTARTGSGKTFIIPMELLKMWGVMRHYSVCWLFEGRLLSFQAKVVVTQPRRVAAREPSRHTAAYMQVVEGEKVGYSVRFDEKQGPLTKLL